MFREPSSVDVGVGGVTSGDGFQLSLHGWEGVLIVEHTRGYRGGFRKIVPALIALPIAILLTHPLSLFWQRIFASRSTSETIAQAFAVGSLAAIAAITFSHICMRRIREWHACEHKAAMLLERNLPANMETLRNIEWVTLRCGTVDGVCGLQAVFLASLAWTSPTIITIGIGLLGALSILDEYIPLRNASILYRLAIPGKILPMAIQAVCTTATPSEHRLKETLAFIQYIRDKHPWTQSYRAD